MPATIRACVSSATDNPGFAAANNQGVADSRSPWLAFINPDLMVEPETLAALRSRAEALGDCLLGVEQVDEQGHADEAVRRRDGFPDDAALAGKGLSWRCRVTRSRCCSRCRHCLAHC